MEKTRFYNREDLKAKDVARLISIWEGEAGESFTDYCNFSREADKNFLLFLAEKYPILYDYHCKVAGNDWLDHCIQYVVDHCGEYLTQWVPAEEYHLSWQLEEMAIYPLADFILKDDGAWEDFVDFFTSEKETASGSSTLTIRICKREIIQLLQDVIVNNNLFHLKRKWSKLMIKKPSASES